MTQSDIYVYSQIATLGLGVWNTIKMRSPVGLCVGVLSYQCYHGLAKETRHVQKKDTAVKGVLLSSFLTSASVLTYPKVRHPSVALFALTNALALLSSIPFTLPPLRSPSV